MVRLLIIILLIATVAAAQTVNLAWDTYSEGVPIEVSAARPRKGERLFDRYTTVPTTATTVSFTGLSSGHKYYFSARGQGGEHTSNNVNLNAPTARQTGRVSGTVR